MRQKLNETSKGFLFKVKGNAFESEIQQELSYVLDGYGKIYQGVYLYSHSLGTFTEIDLLIVTPKKLYSLEAKSFRNVLEGSMHMTMWIGKTSKYVTKIYNPYFQNITHIRALRKTFYDLGVRLPIVENYVIVPNTCRIRSDYDKIFKISQLVSRISEDKYIGKDIIDVAKFDKALDIIQRRAKAEYDEKMKEIKHKINR